MNKLVHDLTEEAVGAAGAKLKEGAKKKAKKNLNKRIRKTRRRVLWSLLVFCAGFWTGVHRKVILAFLRGEPLPKAPEWHFWLNRDK